MQKILSKHLVASGASTDETRYMPIYRKLKLVEILLVPNATTGADGSNYAILTVSNGSTSLAVRNTASAALTAGTAESLTLTATKELDFDALESLKIVKSHAGSGATVDVEFLFVFDVARDV
tara:strand:+ start:256 stop:621 length:366 start_codon:yes stop_codon:yes gene_type:complete